MIFTKEQLQHIIETDHVQCGEASALARIALASLEAEAVAWIIEGGKGDTPCHLSSRKEYAEAYPDRKVTPLYAAPPAPVSMKDHQIRELVNELRDIAVEYHGTQQLRERIARTVRAAMLQGAENAESRCTIQTAPVLDSLLKKAESRCSNSPVIPDGWAACSERMPDPDSAFRVCAYTPTPHEDVRFRFVPASLFKSVCRDATHWQYMLPPAAPQQEA